MNKARSGRGRGANPGRGFGRQAKSRDATGLPKRTGEVGACAELGNNMFTLGKDSKAKDADQFRKTSEAMALYIGTKYGEESAREFEQCVEFVHPIPAVDAAVTLIHGAKVLAHATRINTKLTAMRLLNVQVLAAAVAAPTDIDLVEKSIELNDKILSAEQQLLEPPDVEGSMTGEQLALYKNAYRSYREAEQKLITSRGKVYALILGQCTQTMKDALKEDADWLDVSEKYEAIRLYKLIEKCVLRQTTNKYRYLMLQEELRSLVNFKQEDGMSSNTYYEKLANRVAIFERVGGVFHTPELLAAETEELHAGQDYDNLTPDEKLKVRAVVKEKFCACLFLDRSDNKEHQQLKDSVKNAFAKGDPKAFPTTITQAMQLMSDYRKVQPEKGLVQAQGTAFAGAGTAGGGKKQKNNRLSSEEWWALTPEARKKIDDKRKADREAKEASEKKKSKPKDVDDDDDKSVKSLQKKLKESQMQLKAVTNSLVTIAEKNDDDDSELSEDGSNHFAMSEVSPMLGSWYTQLLKTKDEKKMDLSDEVMLDSCTTHSIMCNRRFLKGIKKTKKELNMSGNGGKLRITKVGTIRGLYPKGYEPAEAWFDERCITNLLSFKELVKMYRITYDSDVCTSFTVHRSEYGLVDLHFRMHESGLHILVKPDGTSGRVFIQTVEENKKKYTSRQVAGADTAKALYEHMTYPGIGDFINTLRGGHIRDCRVSVEDGKRMFAIYGPHVMRCKGTEVTKTNKYKQTNIVAVPRSLIRAQSKVVLCIDMFFVNKYVFITTYSVGICYTTTSHVSTKAVKHYWPYLLQVIQMYTARGFRIVMIRGDFEFNGIANQVAELPSAPRLDLVSRGHIGPVERNIQYVKQKGRSLWASLPYEQLPGIVVIYLVLHATRVVNYFPRSGGIPNYSPRMIMRDEQLSMDELRLPFGTYVQVKEPSTQSNSMLPRTRGAIALGPSGNTTGGQVFMALDTGHLIRRSQYRIIPVTAEVRARVEQLGANEPRQLTWYNRHGDIIGDKPAWDAGHTTADADRAPPPVDEIEDATVQDEQDVENEEWDPVEEVLDLNVDDDITGVDPHIEDVVDEWEAGEQENGDVIEQAIEQAPDEPTPTTVDDTVGKTVEGTPATGRPQRVRKPPESFIPSWTGKKYSYAMAVIMEKLHGKTADQAMQFMGHELRQADDHEIKWPEVTGMCMVQLSLKAADAKFGTVRTKKAALAEVKQIHMRNTFVPRHWSELTAKQKKEVLEAFMFVEQKKSGDDKGRLVINGKMQRGHITKEEASSPTASTDAILLTSVIDALERRDVATVDIPNAFVQTVVADTDKDYRVIVRLRGRIVDILCEIAPEVYLPYVTVNKKGEKILIVQCLNALYGTMVASLLYYKKFVTSLEKHGFKLNPYDPCVANKTVDGSVLTVCFHVDDCKISHKSSKVVDETIDWLRAEYEVIFEDGTGAMKVHRGKVHEYLGMRMDFSHKGEVHLTMPKHLKDVQDTYDAAQAKFNDDFIVVKKRTRSKNQLTAAPIDIFVVDQECKKLPQEQREVFHCLVAKLVFVWKRVRPDIGVAMSFLTKRVKQPDLDDWRKLEHLMDYLKADKNRPLILAADKTGILIWYIDAAFAVHANGRSHTGGGLYMRKGFIISLCGGQKLNTRSSTEAEIVGVDDCMTLVLWVREFLIAQGIAARRNVILQDNKSSILLEENGKASAGKRMRHINIRYFLVTDRRLKGECEIGWIRREDMVADYLTKAQQGAEYRRNRNFIMGSV